MEDELWLEFDGIPLKWTIPIGVLFDLLAPAPALDTPAAPGTAPCLTLPWRLTVHFQSFPSAKIARCKTLFTVRQHFINSWKESSFLRFASNKIAQACSPAEHQRLWDSIIQLREDVYVATLTRLLSQAVLAQHNPSSGGVSPSHGGLLPLVQAALENRSVEDLAIRLYLHCTRPGHEEGSQAETHMCPIQRPFKPKNKENGQESTLGDLIAAVLPGLMDKGTGAAANSRPSSPAPPASPSSATSAAPSSLSLLPHVRLLVQGFAPPLSTPLWWLCTYCSHPDQWLYVTVHITESESEEELALRDPFGTGANTTISMPTSGFGSTGAGSTGGGGLMSSMMGNIGLGSYYNLGGGSSMGGAQQHSLPGYHAATNAMNVVYQNLPSLPLPSLVTSGVSALFGSNQSTAAAAAANAAGGAEGQPQQSQFDSSSGAGASSPSSRGRDLDIDGSGREGDDRSSAASPGPPTLQASEPLSQETQMHQSGAVQEGEELP